MPILERLHGSPRDLGGGLQVRRLLPSSARQSVGPFVFFDHFGPLDVQPESRLDVRPHPHIGLATVTYLFEGAMHHRDSLGHSQRIEPGAINWMNSGRGIVHSERQPQDLRGRRYRLHGLQLWVALPPEREESEPSFTHTGAERLPEFGWHGVTGRVLVGDAFGVHSPVVTASETIYAVLELDAATRITLPPLARELAAYAIDGEVIIDGIGVPAGELAVLVAARESRVESTGTTRLVLIGGEPLGQRRFMWWNFVSTRRERIVAAAADWESRRMGEIAGETDFIPLPERRPDF